MARVFRHQYSDIDPNTGKRRLSKKWYIEFRDADGKRRRVVGFKDRRSTDTKASELEKEAEQIRAGLKPRVSTSSGRNLSELLDLFAESMRTKGLRPRHIQNVVLACRKVFDGCGFIVPSQIDLAAVQSWFSDRRAGKRFSAKTAVHYRNALGSFGKWISPKFHPFNPFASGVATTSPESDRRHVRRVLTADELNALLEATRSGKTRSGIAPTSRALLYEVAARTGFRALELSRLTPEMFLLDASPPAIELPGRFTKNGRPAAQPIPIELAQRLAPLITTKRKGAAVWPSSNRFEVVWNGAAKMLRYDLAAAKIPYRDESGKVFDFHALRAQFGSDLARAGVSIQYAQKLMRHSSPTMTTKHYTLLDRADLAEAVEKIGKQENNFTIEDTLQLFGLLWCVLWCRK